MTAPLPFTLPPPEQIGSILPQFGVSEQTTLVIYGEAGEMSVHRVWWVLIASGHLDVRVLDGGIRRWRDEGRALASGPANFTKSEYKPTPRNGFVATRSDVERTLSDPAEYLINALPRRGRSGLWPAWTYPG